MEELFLKLLPILDAGGSVALIIMLKIAWSIYQRIISIEKELGVAKVTVDNIKERVESLEGRVDGIVTKVAHKPAG